MKRLFILCITASLLLGCGVAVKTAFEPKIDFAAYKSFCWLESCEFTFTGPRYLNDTIIRQNLQKAVIAEMQQKGLNFLSNDPDLLLDVHVVVETDTAFVYHRHNDDMAFQPFTNIEEVPLLKGTLVIDMVDQKTGAMVWRSVAQSYLDIHPDLTEMNFRKGVKLALKDFPPGKK